MKVCIFDNREINGRNLTLCPISMQNIWALLLDMIVLLLILWDMINLFSPLGNVENLIVMISSRNILRDLSLLIFIGGM